MTFTLGKQTAADYGLLASGLLDPPNRVVIMVIIGALPQVLIDGVITSHQVLPTNKPGQSTLQVFGKDVSVSLDLEEKSNTFPNQADSVIVGRLLASYGTLGLIPAITPTTDVPIQTDRVPTQQGTDLAFIKALADRNGYVFYIEPTVSPGVNTAYWGLDNRLGLAQSALTMNMGADTNTESMSFTFDALGPATPEVTFIEPTTKLPIPIPVPTGLHPPLALRPASSLRRTIPRDTSNLSAAQAALKALSSVTESADAVTGTGTLDAVRYGRALRARRLVGVRGVGFSYDGNYYVKEVTHRIKRGEYKQSFSISREGRGALTLAVTS